jgi:hypothetical protein
MNQSDALNLVYASKYASTANYWKNRQGMIDALLNLELQNLKQLKKLNLTNGLTKKQIKLNTEM